MSLNIGKVIALSKKLAKDYGIFVEEKYMFNTQTEANTYFSDADNYSALVKGVSKIWIVNTSELKIYNGDTALPYDGAKFDLVNSMIQGEKGNKGDKGDQGDAGIDGTDGKYTGLYDEARTYSVEDVVMYNDRVYICKNEITVPESFNENNWGTFIPDPNFNGILYLSSDPENPQLNDWRLRSEGLTAWFERRNANGTWTAFGEQGGSFSTDRLYIKDLNDDPEVILGIYYQQKDELVKRVIWKETSLPNGVEYGDIKKDTYVTSSGRDKLYHSYNNGEWFNITQPLNDEEIPSGEYVAEFISSNPEDLMVGYVIYDIVSPCKGMIEIRDVAQDRVVYKTMKDYQYDYYGGIELEGYPLDSNGKPRTNVDKVRTGLIAIPFSNQFFINSNVNYRVTIKHSQGSMRGSTIDGKKLPYFRVYGDLQTIETVATREWVDEQTPDMLNQVLDEEDKLVESKAIYDKFIEVENSIPEVLTQITTDKDKIVESKAIYDFKAHTESALETQDNKINSLVGGSFGIISVEDLLLLKEGVSGQHYVLTNDGIAHGKNLLKDNHIYIVKNFDYTLDAGKYIEDSDYYYAEPNVPVSTGIYITNVQPSTSGKITTLTMNDVPDDGSVKSISTDEETSLIVTVEWDRNSNVYVGQPTINGIAVTVINTIGSTSTGSAVVPISELIDNKLIAKMETVNYPVDVSFKSAPTIQDVVFGDLPIGQTALKEGDNIEATVTADSEFNQIVVDDYELGTSQIFNVMGGVSNKISITVAERNLTTPTSQRVRVHVKGVNDTISEKFTSVNTVLLDNTKPTLTFDSVDYPVGQFAIKGLETATINFTCDDTKFSVSENIIGNNLSVDTMDFSNGVLTVVGNGTGDYVTDTDNIRIAVTYASTNRSANFTTVVKIVNSAPAITDINPVQVKSGAGYVNIPVNFDQEVNITGGSIPVGTMGSIVNIWAETHTISVSASDTDPHSSSNLNASLNITGLSGLTATLNRIYQVRGFAQKTFTLTYPSLSQDVGVDIVNSLSIVCSGLLNTATPLTVANIYDASNTLDDARKFGVVGDVIHLSSELLNFGYTTGVSITLTVEEV